MTALAAAVTTALLSCGAPKHPPSPVAPDLYNHRPTLAAAPTAVLRGRRILLDPGHGGRFGGTEGVNGTREADVNLGVALHLWGLLHDAGAEVWLTRSSDRDLLGPGETAASADLAARVACIDSLRPDVFLSLHHNSNSALDRERNAIETYYKLDDDGPSYDLGRAIQNRLAAALGIDVARLLPGNYFVLRGAGSAAVLGEASYLSNPRVESVLELAAKQRLEAEAYFLGLVDYFAHGVASVEPVAAGLDTIAIGAVLEFRTGLPFEPATAVVRVDGNAVPVELDAHERRFATIAAWDAGGHAIEAEARLVQGNAARTWRGRVVAYAPPAQAVLAAEPAAPGGRTRARARIADEHGQPVADGVPVRWRVEGARVLDADSTVAGGEALAWLEVTAGRPRIEITCGVAHDAVTVVRADSTNPAPGIWQCIDARTGAAVAGAWSLAACSDRRGLVALGADSVLVRRRGYAPWRGVRPSDGVVRLQALRGGVFLEVPLVVDPAGQGGEPALPGLGFAGGDAAFDLGRMLAGNLEALGARPVLTRGVADAVADLDRVRTAARVGARWFLRLEVTAARTGGVAYYPGSEAGQRTARALADALRGRGFTMADARADAHFVLQQTPCPAVWVQLPGGAIGTVDARRGAVAALTTGLLLTLDPAAAGVPPLWGRTAPGVTGVAVLDGAETVPVADGRFHFEHVTPGEHWVALLDSTASEVTVHVSGTDTLWVGSRR